jgi:hypothetical protein
MALVVAAGRVVGWQGGGRHERMNEGAGRTGGTGMGRGTITGPTIIAELSAAAVAADYKFRPDSCCRVSVCLLRLFI